MRGYDISGERFHCLTAVKRDHKRARSQAWVWVCKCDCGKETLADVGQLRAGGVKSCGCKRGIETKHGMHNSPTYLSWKSMKARCDNPNNPDFEIYGGRGISYSAEFAAFESFLAHMGKRPLGMTLDRKDNMKGYTPENCRWSSPKTQSRNKRNARMITYEGETKCLAEWAEITGIGQSAISSRLKRGWSVEKALTTLTVQKEHGVSKVAA